MCLAFGKARLNGLGVNRRARDAYRMVCRKVTLPSFLAGRAQQCTRRAEAVAKRVRRGEFVVTAELSPPRGFDISETLDRLRPIVGSGMQYVAA